MTPAEQLREKIAMALCEAEGDDWWREGPEGLGEAYASGVQAVLNAIRDSGWAIVPREATSEMIEAWVTAEPIPDPDEDADRAWAQADWSAMIAASPLEAGR